jgi:thioredoxin reductase
VANPQIEVRYHTQVTAIEGTEHIGAVHLRDEDGNVVREDTTGLFIFIGAKPSEVFDLKPTSGNFCIRVEFMGWRRSRNCSTATSLWKWSVSTVCI